MADLTVGEAVADGSAYAPRQQNDYKDNIDSGGTYSHDTKLLSAKAITEDRSQIDLLTKETSGIVNAYNNTGGQIDRGTPVYITWDAANDRYNMAKAKADALSTLATHVTNEDVADASSSELRRRVKITGTGGNNYDTSAFTEADQLYLSATTAGALTATAPTGAGQFAQRIGVVEVDSATVGSIQHDIKPAEVVGSGSLQDLSVATAKIAALAVTTAKIAALAVTTSEIAGLAVTTAKIAADAVDNSKIADGAVSSENLDAGLKNDIPDLNMVVGSEDSPGANDIQVTIQARDANDANLSANFLTRLWVSSADKGAPPGGGGPTLTVATGTTLYTRTANEDLDVITDSSGTAVITLNIAGAATWYLMAEIDGRIYSATVTWSA